MRKKLLKFKGIKFNFHNYLKKIIQIEFRKFFPKLYILVVILGLVLTGIHYSFFPDLVTCSSFFGEEFCTPTGIFIIIFISIPAYIVAGNVVKFIGELPGYTSFVIVLVISLLFYYLIGLVLDKQKGKPFNVATISKIIIFLFFIILLVLGMSLS